MMLAQWHLGRMTLVLLILSGNCAIGADDPLPTAAPEAIAAASPAAAKALPSVLPDGQWKLLFADEFDGTEEELDKRWLFQNGPNTHILCSRWRDNARLVDGWLQLTARKESRGGQDWTAASLQTREEFRYGYFECRYRYAAATGTNNSFWLMSNVGKKEGAFEIDINEGHFPNEVNTNTHRWWDKHISSHKAFPFKGQDMAADFHTYGLRWTPTELIWYVDGKELRRSKNDYCHLASPVRLSLAIITWAGVVTDAIDGKTMVVDYVRVYADAASNISENTDAKQ